MEGLYKVFVKVRCEKATKLGKIFHSFYKTAVFTQ